MDKISKQNWIKELIKNTPLTAVQSTNIQAIGYNRNSRILRVLFKNNSCYIYFNIEPELYINLIESAHVGKILYESVIKHKEKYRYIKVQNRISNN